jgi:hypothetical protein
MFGKRYRQGERFKPEDRGGYFACAIDQTLGMASLVLEIVSELMSLLPIEPQYLSPTFRAVTTTFAANLMEGEVLRTGINVIARLKA